MAYVRVLPSAIEYGSVNLGQPYVNDVIDPLKVSPMAPPTQAIVGVVAKSKPALVIRSSALTLHSTVLYLDSIRLLPWTH